MGRDGRVVRDVRRRITVRGAHRVAHRPTTQHQRAKTLPTGTRHLDTPSEWQIIQTPRVPRRNKDTEGANRRLQAAGSTVIKETN